MGTGSGSGLGSTGKKLQNELLKSLKLAANKSKGKIRVFDDIDSYHEYYHDENDEPDYEKMDAAVNGIDIVPGSYYWPVGSVCEANTTLPAMKKFESLIRKTKIKEISDWAEYNYMSDMVKDKIMQEIPAKIYNPIKDKSVNVFGQGHWGIEQYGNSDNQYYVYLSAPRESNPAYIKAVKEHSKEYEKWQKYEKQQLQKTKNKSKKKKK